MSTRTIAVGLLAAGLVLVPTAAQAHVRVIPESTAAEGFSKLTFRVPTESDTASTVKLTVDLPTATPLSFVSAQPVPGWTVKITESKLATPVTVFGTTLTKAPSQVTWTAEKGQGVGPGEFQEFSLSAGPLPAAGTQLAFPATQTYSDGTVAKWDQPQAEGAAEPEHPVPAFTVTAETGDGHDAPAAAAATSSGSSDDASDGLAVGLGAGGLAAGVLGLLLGALALRRSGQRTAEA